MSAFTTDEGCCVSVDAHASLSSASADRIPDGYDQLLPEHRHGGPCDLPPRSRVSCLPAARTVFGPSSRRTYAVGRQLSVVRHARLRTCWPRRSRPRMLAWQLRRFRRGASPHNLRISVNMDSNTFVITIGRQLGSGGRAVGERIAPASGRALSATGSSPTLRPSRAACVPSFRAADEKRSRGLFSAPDRLPACALRRRRRRAGNVLSGETLFKDTERRDPRAGLARVIRVFVGRCADYVLRDHPRRLDVFVVGLACRVLRAPLPAPRHRTRGGRGDDGPRDARRLPTTTTTTAAAAELRPPTICSIDLVGARHRKGTADCVLGFAAGKLGLTIE